MAKKRIKLRVSRSAKTGRFVSAAYARSHPTTTVVETIWREIEAKA